jgi:hypothetical protein
MRLYGLIVCPNCHHYTPFYSGEGGQVYTLGSKIDNETNEIFQDKCEYCETSYDIHYEVKKGKLFSFYSDANYKTNQTRLTEGRCTEPFHLHPVSKEKGIKIDKEHWTIKEIYRKEYIDRDIDLRINHIGSEEYWYKVQNRQEEKWYIVRNSGTDNAIFTQDPPFIEENEKIYDITDSGFTLEELYQDNWGDFHTIEAYQILSGVEIWIYNEEGQVELNVLEDTLDEGLQKINELFSWTI